jgi:hypothetical protein
MAYDSQTAILNRQDFDTTYTNEFDNDQTAANIITPTSGKSLKVVGYYINTEATSGTIRLYFATSANTVGEMYAVNVSATGYVPLVVTGQRNEPLKITSTLGAGQNYFLSINYKEE